MTTDRAWKLVTILWCIVLGIYSGYMRGERDVALEERDGWHEQAIEFLDEKFDCETAADREKSDRADALRDEYGEDLHLKPTGSDLAQELERCEARMYQRAYYFGTPEGEAAACLTDEESMRRACGDFAARRSRP